VKRGAGRAAYDPSVVHDILDAGTIAHVGVSTPEGPIVLPMAYGRTDDKLYIHGSVANAMMRAGRSVDVCATITIVDGLVVARTPFHNSMNYRSVVVRGEASVVPEDRKLETLRIINDHIVATWDIARPPSDIDLRKTMVLEVPLTEASAKVRGEAAIDEEIDLDGPYWAGVVPLTSTWGAAIPNPDLRSAISVPGAVASMEGTDANPGKAYG
jgi:nitroimidazol reductase NimA-like FMN-containing flavoprotein (pyridoxamine 5'-phosphate oxidase superfamily)